MKFYRYPVLGRMACPGAWYRLRPPVPAVYLTFDDGPDPASTPVILDILDRFDAKATFFCLGERAKAWPELAEQIKNRGHRLAAHGQEHLKAFSTSGRSWLDNAVQGAMQANSPLFRPPYGQILPGQCRVLKKMGLQVVLWDLMLYDFQAGAEAAAMLRVFQRKARPGSIVVMHDKPRLNGLTRELLPAILDEMQQRNWQAIHLPLPGENR